jgi:hypothetical protein
MTDGSEFTNIRRGINTRRMMHVRQVWATGQLTMFRVEHNKGCIVRKENIIVKEVMAHMHKLVNRRYRDEGRSKNMVLGTCNLKS